MLRIAKNREVWWPVEVLVPRAEGDGRCEPVTVKLRFRLLSRKALAGTGAADQEQLIVDHVLGWEGISDEAGNPIAFDEAALRAVLDIPYVEKAFVTGLIQASWGAEAKN